MRRKLTKLLLLLAVMIVGSGTSWAETDYTSLMGTWTGSYGSIAGFQGGNESYRGGSDYEAGWLVLSQSVIAPAAGIYEIKFYAVASSTSGRGWNNVYGSNIAQAFATAGSNQASVSMEVINQTGCTLAQESNIRTLSIEADEGQTITFGLKNIANGGNWYTIKSISLKMKTVAEVFQAQYDEAYNIWQYSTENETGARATFKLAVDALQTAMSGTLAQAQQASNNLSTALETYKSKSYPVKGHGVKYDFTSKMNMAINAWTCVKGNGPAQYGFTGATETYGVSGTGEVMYQTLSGLSNGEYEIHFYAVANAANGGGTAGSNLAYVYANDVTEDIDVIQQNGCTPSDYERILTVTIADGTIKYGVSNKADAGNWYVCKNVALYMIGAPDLSDFYNAIDGNLTTANSIKDSKMKASIATSLQEAISGADGYQDITVIGTLETINTNLVNAINDANTSISNYNEALTIINAAEPLDETGKNAYNANETVAAIKSAYEAGTLEAVTDEQKTTCATALIDAFKTTVTLATLDGGKKYLLKNIASGKYLSAGNNWGTQATLVANAEYNTLVSVSEGIYHIDSQVSSGGDSHFFNGSYMDQTPPLDVAIYKKSTGEYILTNETAVYGWDGTSTILASNLAITSDNALWEIVSIEDAIADFANATLQNKKDATFLIGDHSFGRNNRNASAWEHGNHTNFTYSGTNGDTGEDFVNNVGESWHSKFYLKQKLTNIPNGVYHLYAQGFYEEGSDNTNLPYFYANDQKLTFAKKTGSEGSRKTAGASFLKGLYVNGPIEVTVIDGNLTIGAENESNEGLWIAWDNFTLMFVSPIAEATSVADLAATAGNPVILNAEGLEILNKDANDIAVQEVSAQPAGILIKGVGNVDGASSAEYGKGANVLLLGTYNADTHEFTVEDHSSNSISVAGNSSTVNEMAIGAAADKQNTYLLVKVENATITEEGDEFYANDDNTGDKIKIDKRLDANIKVNDGDLAYEITGITFLDGDVCVLAPLSKNAIIDNKAEATEGDSYAQGDKVNEVEGVIMSFGGNNAEGAQYVFAAATAEVNNFATVTEGVGQFPVDDEGKAYNKDEKNLPTTGTFYVFEPTKDGQLEATVGVEKGKTLIVTEDGEAIIEQKQDADFEGPVTFPVEATKTYYVFAPETNMKFFGFKFIPTDPDANNIAKDIETFKLLPANAEGDTLLLKDAVVTYIKGDDVFVEDASGAIDFYRTEIQFYVGQKLNGYIIGKNEPLDNMPALRRTDATKYGHFKVTEKVTPEATAATVADVTTEENLARFMKLEFVEYRNNNQGFRVFVDPTTGDEVRFEDRFGVFYELGDLMEKVEGIVGISKEGTFTFWPTSKEGVVVSDGYKKMVETELDVTNKDMAKSKNNPVVGISLTLDGACNAGSGSSMAGAMTSKGYKLRTANGSPDKNSAKFTVNDNQKVFDMTINAVANYAAKDTEKPCITVTKVEVDGKEVSFEGGEFPAKGASDCGSLILKGINAEKDIVIYFDNSNAEGTQLNMAYAITCRGEKVYTQKEKDLMAEAKKLAEDREAVAVGCLDDAIEAAEAGNTSGLKKAVDQFKADNATSSVDYTDKVGKAVANWVNVQNCPSGEFKIYSGNGVNLVQVFGVTGEGPVLSQEVSGLDNGTYNIGLYATSHNAWNGDYGENKAGKPTLQEDAGSVAYVYGTSGDNTVKTWIVARRNSALTANEPELYKVNGVKVENGKLTVGLALAQKAMTEWHSIQIGYLRMETTAKEAYAAEKAKLVALLEEAEELLDGDQIGGKAKLQEAVDEANEAKESIRLNIDGMAAEVAKLRAAIELAQSSNIQADYNVAYTEGVEAEAGEEFFLYNIGSGMFLTDGMDWGTHASADHAGRIITLATAGKGFSIYTKPFAANDNDEKAGFMTTNGYVDTANNDAEWEFTPVEIDGYTNAYTISNSSSQYLFYETKSGLYGGKSGAFVNVGDNTRNTKSYWLLIPKSKRDELGDVTYLLRNTDFCHPWELVMWKNTAEWTNYCGGLETNTLAEMYHKSFDVSQEISVEIPNGNYEVSVQGFYNADEGSESGAYLYANSEQVELKKFNANNEGTAANMNGASESFNAGLYVNTVRVIVTDGKLKVGIKTDDVHNWVAFDNFSIKYLNVTPVAISETVAEPARFEDGAIYNLRGQKMEGTLKPGLYIKNGRKFVVK